MKHIFFLILGIFIFQVQYAQENKFINNLINAQGCEHASFTILGVDTQTGDTIFAYDEQRSLAPASVMKLFSTAAALELKGPDYRFKTELAYSGKINDNGILNGNIYIIGYGDPALGSSRFDNYYNNPENFLNLWVNAIKKAGIKQIDGSIIGDPSEFCYPIINDSWLWEDIANHYGSPACGLSIGDNIYSLYFKTGKTEGSSTELLRMEPKIQEYSFDNYVTSSTTGGDQAYIFGGQESTKRIIRGSLPCNNQAFRIKGIIADPPLYAAQTLQSLLNDIGIKTSKNAKSLPLDSNRPETKVIHTILSPFLSQIIKLTNMWSINLYAEHMAVLCGIELNKDAYSGGNSVKEFWKNQGMDVSGMQLEDGCGLSHFNNVCASHLVFLLTYMHQSTNKEEFLASLPIVGKSGSMQWYCKYNAAKGNIQAKGGSMTRVRSIAGYANTKSGKNIAFAVIVNNYSCENYLIKQHLNNFMKEIVVEL